MTILFEEHMRDHDPAEHLASYPVPQRDRIIDAALSAPTSLKTRRQRPVRILVAAAVAVCLTGLGYQSVTVGAANAQAAEVLTQAAIHATDPVTSADQYWKITTTGTNLADGSEPEPPRTYLVRTNSVDYVAVDGSRPSWYVREPSVAIEQLQGPDAPRAHTGQSQIWTMDLSPAQIPGWWGEPSPTWLASLPRDPHQLRERLYADSDGHGSNPDDEAFVYVADVLRSGLVPADLRAALYEVLKLIPGTTVTGTSVTLNGHEGVAIGRNDLFGSHKELVIDPATGQVVGELTRVKLTPVLGPEVTLQLTVQRELVDRIPESVQRNAVHQHCTVANGEVNC